jgi:hypothetical protein
MRHEWSSKTSFCLVAATLAGPLYAQSATAKPKEGEQITSACVSAGYK